MGINLNTIPVRLLGIGTLGLVASEAVKTGISNGVKYAENDTANYLTDVFVKHQSAPYQSGLLNKLKNMYKLHALDENFFGPINTSIHTAKNIAKELFINSFIPTLLCIGAICDNGSSRFSVGKLCTLGLLIGAAKTYMVDVVGIGKKNKI